VADVHPITHPPNTKRIVCKVWASVVAATTTKTTAHTAAHPTL
jgi:hypothetical protein